MSEQLKNGNVAVKDGDSTIVLSEREWERFVYLLENPRKPSRPLIKLLRDTKATYEKEND